MSKRTGNTRIVLSYSVILVACLFLVTFTIISSVIAREKFQRLDQVSNAEGTLDEVNRLVYRMDGQIKDFIQSRDSLMEDEIRAGRKRVLELLQDREMTRVREVVPEILRLYKDIQRDTQNYVAEFETILALNKIHPDYTPQQLVDEGFRIYQTKIIPLRDKLILDSDSSIEFIRGKKEMARASSQNFLYFILIVSVIVIGSLISAVIPFIITAATGLFIPKSGINRIMLMDYDTDLYNRNYLYETMTNYKNLSDRYQTAVGLLAVGINRFDELEQQIGKKNAMRVLKSAAETIQHTCRNYDFTARYERNEFFILTPENNRDNLTIMANRLKERMEASNIYLKNKKRIHIEVSMAIGEYRDIIHCYGEVQVSNLIKLMLDRMRDKMRSGGGIDVFECDRDD